MKINKIKKLANGKYKIEFDNNQKLTTYDEVILKNNLLFNKNIDSSKLNNIINDNDYYHIYNKCINYISIKMRSEKEIKEYIIKQDENANYQKIIKELKDKGFINDNIFLKSFIADKINLSTNGPEKIKSELINHNIDIKLIDEELNKIDEEIINEKLIKLITKKIKNNNKYSNYHLKQKVVNDLINLGYKKENILYILNNFDLDDNNALKKEYEKQLRLLSKKYKGQELNYKIKQKLYQKGFNSFDIENILN